MPSLDHEYKRQSKKEYQSKGLMNSGNPTEAMLTKFDSLLGFDTRNLDQSVSEYFKLLSQQQLIKAIQSDFSKEENMQ